MELFVTLIVFFSTYVGQFVANKYLERRKEAASVNRLRNASELKRIEWQLGEVFGPLRARLLCNKAAFSALVRSHTKGVMKADSARAFLDAVMQTPALSNPDDDESTAPALDDLNPQQRDYVLWVRHVFQPANRTVLDILTYKANAFDRRIPP